MLNLSRAVVLAAVAITMGAVVWFGPAAAVPGAGEGSSSGETTPRVAAAAGKNGFAATLTKDGKPASSGGKAASGPVRTPTEEEAARREEIASTCRYFDAQVKQFVESFRKEFLDGSDFYQANCVSRGSAGDLGSAARQVVAGMDLAVPAIGIVPYPSTVVPDSVGLVNLQNWMWVDNPEIFETVTDTARLDGWEITVSGRVVSVDWDMGDGQVIGCAGPGTPYVLERDGFDPSPTCGHVYTKQGYYTVTATARWQMDWSGGGQSGTVMMDSTSSVPIVIGELHTVRRS